MNFEIGEISRNLRNSIVHRGDDFGSRIVSQQWYQDDGKRSTVYRSNVDSVAASVSRERTNKPAPSRTNDWRATRASRDIILARESRGARLPRVSHCACATGNPPDATQIENYSIARRLLTRFDDGRLNGLRMNWENCRIIMSDLCVCLLIRNFEAERSYDGVFLKFFRVMNDRFEFSK